MGGHRGLRVWVILAVLLGGAAAGMLLRAPSALAETFSNTTTITLPDPNCTDPDAGSPYPSNIVVSGLSGTVTDVNVTLNGVTHPFQGDLEVLLVGPAGGAQNLTLLSDAGTGSLSNATITIDDAAAAMAPQNTAWAPGTYKPTNYTELSGADPFPAPAPVPSGNTTLAGAFDGINPNGTWSLFVTDDACPDAGSIGGGWSLEITTAAAAAVTNTSVTSSLNPSRTGQSVTFTATVTSAGNPVTTGTVTFTEGATVLAANVPLNGSGQATFSTSGLAEGNHIVQATYNGTPSFATSNGTVNQRVDNNTTVTGNTYCNTGPVTINDNGPATPYPSNIFVTGAGTVTSKVTVTLNNVSHTFAGDIEALLVGPGGQNLVVVSDAGTTPGVSNVTVTFDDAAAGTLPVTGTWAAPNSTISARPTNHSELSPDTFPPPAPAPSAATTLTTFNGANPNGTWSLYVMDDGAPDTGSIAGGWCITVSTLASPTLTTQASAGGPVGTQVNDVATLASGANPTGSITFNLYGPGNNTCTGSPAHTSNVVVSGNGTYTSSNFTPTSVGTYRWTATYSGDANNAPAGPTACLDPDEDVTITQVTPTIATQASAGGPVGTAVNDVATVSGGVNPTGTVTFSLFSDAACTAQVFTSTNPLIAGTATSSNFTPAAPGTYRWTATYSGDANNAAAGPTACLDPDEDVTITQATPSISTQASSSSSVTATAPASITDTATLAGGFDPTGTLTFALFGPDNATCTGTPVFTSTKPVTGNGTYVSDPFTTATLGAYRWVVIYSGDANNLGATSPCNAPNETSEVTVVCSAVPTAGTLPGNTIVVAQPGIITTGTPGDDVIYGTAGDDRIDGAGGNDVIFGGGDRDQLTGGEGNDTVCGGDGNDQLVGSSGNDLLSGDAGNDDLAGLAGNDRLIGGPGVNRLSGGDGVDACSPGPDPASQAASCESAVV